MSNNKQQYWKDIFEAQGKLDKAIREGREVTRDNITKDVGLALLVEIGEAVNEARFFKFWSVDRSPRREKLLEEMIDVLHFITTLSMSYGHGSEIVKTGWVNYHEEHNPNWHIAFANLFRNASILNTNIIIDRVVDENFTDLFTHFITVVQYLGFSEEEVYNAYFAKNKKNFERQANGY